MGRDVSPLASLRAADATRYGGKSAALGELLAAGIRVPPGFALPCAAVDRGAVDDAYAALAAECALDDPPVAVRSSAIGEDSAEATFAGQMESVLWVRGVGAVHAAIDRCRASLDSAEATAYRAHLGPDVPAAMGVAVQLMVDAAISGVMFTCNPVSGDPSMVAINASWGLGTAVVAGEVTPDDYLVSKVTREVVRERVGDKRIEYVPDRRDVPPERATARCLDGKAIAALVDLARAIQSHFGCHQDIEWAIARTGAPPANVFILQSRPVTAIPKRPAATAPASAISLVMGTFGARPPDRC